jgi:UDPglucose 6-dehydrogenase
MKISVIGAGYVGLVTGACLAETGHQVTCVDIDAEKVAKINQGIPPIYEPGLDELMQRHVGAGLVAATDLRHAVLNTELTFIAVGTPFNGASIDLSHIQQASRAIGQVLMEKSAYHVVVVKSTVVPGTTDTVVRDLLEEYSGKRAGIDFGLGMNPEFIREGVAVMTSLQPDRIVLGGMDERTINAIDRVYEFWQEVPKLRTNNKTAEMIKYAANSTLATMISFANEIGNLCAAIGDVDVVEVMRGVHLSRDFTAVNGHSTTAGITSFLFPGCGFGGSCLPKDVKALVAHGQSVGQPMPLLNSVIHINQRQPARIVKLLQRHFASLKEARIAVLGLSFKPDTDDIRESPALPIINDLLAKGALVRAFDPAAQEAAMRVLPKDGIEFADSLESAVNNVDAVVLVTKWEQFRKLPKLLARQKPPPLFVDGRRMLNKNSFARYTGVGLSFAAALAFVDAA